MKSEPAVIVDPVPPETTALSAREAAIQLARSGSLLNGRELRAILQIRPSTFFYHQAHGRYDKLKVKLPIGPRCYSGVLVSRQLDGRHVLQAYDGDAVYTPTFGRKRGL